MDDDDDGEDGREFAGEDVLELELADEKYPNILSGSGCGEMSCIALFEKFGV